MQLPRQLTSPAEVLTIGRKVTQILKDPASNVARLSTILERVPGLSLRIIRYAEECLGGRRRIQTTTNAVTLIGFDRLERVVDAFLQSEYIRLTSEQFPEPHPLEPRPPVTATSDSQNTPGELAAN